MRRVFPSTLLAIIMFTLAGNAQAQTLGQGGDDPVSVWRWAGALALCLILAIAGAFAIRARSGAGAAPVLAMIARKQRRLQLVEAVRLSNQVDLCLISCDGRTILMAASAQGVQILPHVVSDDGDHASGEAKEGSEP